MSKSYIVKDNETLDKVAEKFKIPSWKHLYQLNKNVIGDNPDILKVGTVLKIPVIEESPGFKLLQEKGVNPFNYLGGLQYHYPMVPVSFTIANADGTVYREFDENGNERAEFSKKKKYEIKDADTGKVLVSGEISKSEEISVLVPDVKRKMLLFDGIEYQLWKEEKK
jgi:hypothetical protein